MLLLWAVGLLQVSEISGAICEKTENQSINITGKGNTRNFNELFKKNYLTKNVNYHLMCSYGGPGRQSLISLRE